MCFNRFLILLYITFALTASSVLKSYGQEKVIITDTDTIQYNIQPDDEEFKILQTFYKQTNGKQWKNNKNWLKGKTIDDMAKWYGVVVRNGDISEIHLPANNLKGLIPNTLYKLDGLIALSIEDNELTPEASKATSSTARLSAAPDADGMSLMNTSLTSPLSAPIIAGKNLPVWGLAVKGNAVQQIDWRTTPPVKSELTSSGPSELGASGVAIDDCGKLAFYVLHSGVDQANQLHIYAPNGVKLTNTTAGDLKQALNSSNGHMELQVVRVPGKADEWFIIYSLFQPPCLTSPPGSCYCPAKIVYTRVKYNAAQGLVIDPGKRETPIANGKTFIQGKAVSRTVNGDASRHYLYLAERGTTTANNLRIHRFIIDAVGINFGTQSRALIPATYWIAGVAGSSIELSPDETKLAISNRNVGAIIKEDIIIVDLNKFDATDSYKTISVPELVVYGTNKTVKQMSLEAQYTCLRYLKNKLSLIEFSPSGRYLYVVHGGYPDNSGGRPYDTYLLQIDLQSSTGTGNYQVRMQVENGKAGSQNCLGSPANALTNNYIQMIQSAYDGKLYFTKTNSDKLFAIPNPDDPMPHDLTPQAVDLSPSSTIAMLNGSKVFYMPENIDGYDYLKESTDPASNKFTLSPPSIGPNESVLLTILNYDALDNHQVSWGDGVIEPLNSSTKSHLYNQLGEYKITLTVLNHTNNCATITSKKFVVEDCAPMKDLDIVATQYLCATKFSVTKIPDCFATYSWNFGDNTPLYFSRQPLHVYAISGDYTVSVKVNYNCGICAREKTFTKSIRIDLTSPQLEDRVLQIPTDQRPGIISSAVTTFSERWKLDHNDPGLTGLNNFINGAQGVWRNEGSFVYNTPRSAPSLSSPVSLRTDGTYTLEFFNWANSDLLAIPKWIKANSITRYNAFSFEQENKDVLDIYAAALYDYDGQLQSAHGVNMRNEEMAFTSFEISDDRPSGNLLFSNKAVPAFRSYKVNSGNSHIGVVEATLQDLQDVNEVDIIFKGYNNSVVTLFSTISRALQNVKILCKQAHPTNPNWSVLVFEDAPFALTWTGEIRVKNTIVPVVAGLLDNTIAHTGKKSLKITTEKVFEQKLLNLEAGKAYHISAWVSINNPGVLTPKLSNNLGIDVVLKNKQGATISTTLIAPDGKIIEGWQQVKGSFTCPEKDLILSLRFKPGSTGSGAWYDDLRLHPDNGNMKTYVYDVSDFKLKAILDENNFASMFFYDKEGNLYLTKKETEEGIKTISENTSYQVEQ
jgi:hypothetical protein